MFKVVDIDRKRNQIGVLDTNDNITEYYTENQLKTLITKCYIPIHGCSILVNGDLYTFTDSDILFNGTTYKLVLDGISECVHIVSLSNKGVFKSYFKLCLTSRNKLILEKWNASNKMRSVNPIDSKLFIYYCRKAGEYDDSLFIYFDTCMLELYKDLYITKCMIIEKSYAYN